MDSSMVLSPRNGWRFRQHPITWIALFQERIWEIPWNMWEHHNQFLHQTKMLHPMEITALNSKINIEWNIGLDDLPRRRYSHLFNGNLTHCINDTPNFKQLWLTSIWTARELNRRNYHLPPIRARNATAADFFEQWKNMIRNN